MTLPEFLTQRSNELSAEFSRLSSPEKKDILARHLQSKAEIDDTPKRLSNLAINRAVSAKLNTITAMVIEYLNYFDFLYYAEFFLV